MSIQLTDQTTAGYYKATTGSEKETCDVMWWLCSGLNVARGPSPWNCAAAADDDDDDDDKIHNVPCCLLLYVVS